MSALFGVDQLAEVIDPAAFEDHPIEKRRQAAAIQWAARRHMARESAQKVLTSDWLRDRDGLNHLQGAAMANSDAIAAYDELVERVEALLAKWDEDRLTYPTEIDERAQFAEIAVRLCGEELRALIDPEATS